LLRNYLIKQVIKEKIYRRVKRGRRCKQLLDDHKE